MGIAGAKTIGPGDLTRIVRARAKMPRCLQDLPCGLPRHQHFRRVFRDAVTIPLPPRCTRRLHAGSAQPHPNRRESSRGRRRFPGAEQCVGCLVILCATNTTRGCIGRRLLFSYSLCPQKREAPILHQILRTNHFRPPILDNRPVVYERSTFQSNSLMPGMSARETRVRCLSLAVISAPCRSS